ncbi:putative rhizopine uptake ABC transporter periplasmic solute-binding protein precursor [Oceanicola granulosus HTCC2516]|uniref:Putative rhizopine uptake ABC transporter periplasmic solute-binding protein n=1 Tax=Oceanicola granulosus (strain ATCC BAA-861 / DSM 15982 / KCTC 12143 / HTCC2516) TaxID=314256 RepID=Q2CJV7_OCEGH|nr:putative rhizopine uptake ABC transporter periplasmic solute-binding protein precursor [Oceanicola granulosus HTCC2516]
MTGGAACAETIGASMAQFDGTIPTMLRESMVAQAGQLMSVDLVVENAANDSATQLDQVNGFLAAGVDAVIVQIVEPAAAAAMTEVAQAAGVPLVFVNREPGNVGQLPDSQSYVGSDPGGAGLLEIAEVCRLLGAQGTDPAPIYVMTGAPSGEAAVRTQDIHDVLGNGACDVMLGIVAEQSAGWSRAEADGLMTAWLSTGEPFDAVVANDDEMALGAIDAMKAAEWSMQDIIVGGIDGTPAALEAVAKGDLDVTVIEDAAGQGAAALAAALNLSAGDPVERVILIPPQLVTPDTVAAYQTQ